MIIGITGGSGCGKTTLLRLIADMGGMVMDCDAIYHQLLETDESLLIAIEDRFSGTVKNGYLDRKALGAIVFADKVALEDLNRITHGAVTREVKRRLAEKPKLAAIDAIGLFESGINSVCHTTVAVTAPEEERVRRLMARDGITEAYARQRIAAQHTDEWFREHCDYVLQNDGTQAEFEAKCVAFLKNLGIMET
jgi:dephospho-CoA kinase